MRTLVILLIMAVCVGLASRGALAHAALIGADPADGAVIASPPDRIILHFNEPVVPLLLRLIGPTGETTDLKQSEVRHQLIEILPPVRFVNGTHLLSWRVVSADGHPTGGSLVFSVGAPSGTERHNAAPQASRMVQVVLWSARIFLYLGLFAGVGGTFFAAWIAGQPKLWGATRGIIIGSIWIGLLGAGLSVGVQGLDALNVPLSSLANSAVWLQGWRTSFGATALIAVIALLLGWLSMNSGWLWQARSLSGVALIGTGVALAASGHASTADPQWLTRTSVFIHVSGLAFWLGALTPLLTMLRANDSRGLVIMNRFSVAILPVVVGLVIAGVLLAVVQVGSIQALRSTGYGNLLLLKLLAVIGLLGLAAANRIVFTPALAREDVGRRRRFAQSIAAEGVLVLLILGLVAGWRFTLPPRSNPATPGNAPTAAPEPTLVHIHSDHGMAQVTLNPGPGGRTTAMITLASGTGTPLASKEVVVALSNPALGIESVERHATQVGTGVWRADDLILPVPGRWRIRVDALVDDFDKVTLESEIDVR